MIYVFDKREIIQAIMSNENPAACPFWGDEITLQLPNGVHLFEFECPGDHPSAEFIAVEGYVAVKDLDDQLLLFRIREIESYHGSDGALIKHIFAESAALELLSDIQRPIELIGYTAQQALQTILVGTSWQPGIVEWGSVASVSFDSHVTTLAAIHEVRAQFGGDLRFRVTFDGVRIIGKYVDFLREMGTHSGQRFEYGKDLSEIRRTENSDDLVTALIGVGKGDADGNAITFANIDGSYIGQDKPLGQDWIGDPIALSNWGKNGKHKFGFFEFDTSDPKTLLNKTWEELKKRTIPKLSYELDAILLERISGGTFVNDRKRLGDTIVVKDSSFVPAILVEARIVEMKIHMTDPSLDRVTLANFVDLDSKLDKVVLDQLRMLVNARRSVWEQPSETIVKSKTAPELPKEDQLWLDTSADPNVLKRWTGSMWIKATPTQPSEVGAEKEIPKQPDPPSNPQPGDIWVKTPDPTKPPDPALPKPQPIMYHWDDAKKEWIKSTRTSLEEMAGKIGSIQIEESAVKAINIESGAITEAKMKWSTHLIF